MAHQDRRTQAAARGGKFATSGRMNVLYKDAKGRTRLATVAGAGTSSGLKLAIGSRDGAVVDNVAKATSMKATNAYVSI